MDWLAFVEIFMYRLEVIPVIWIVLALLQIFFVTKMLSALYVCFIHCIYSCLLQTRFIRKHFKHIVLLQYRHRDHSGSVVECLNRDLGVSGSSLTSVTVLCP